MQPAAQPTAAAGSGRWWALVAMLLAAAMDLIDTTVVNVAVPGIRSGLGASASAAEWVVAGYAVTFGIGLITGGRLGDAFGRRRMFLLGVGGFMVASLVSGSALSPAVLIAGRLAQGLMAALMVPQILTVIQVNFGARQRPKAYAAYGACAAIATVSGPLVGGALVHADLFGLGWRPIFLINLPLGVVSLAATAVWLPESRARRDQRFDLPGVALLALALTLLLYPLIEGPQVGWPTWGFGLIAAAVILFGVFALHERFRARRGGWPLVTVGLFRQRAFAGGVATQLALYAAVTGFFLVLAVTLQSGFGYTALQSGLTFLPFSIGIAASSGASGALAAKLGRRLSTTGVLVMAAGMAILLLTVQLTGPSPSTGALAPGLLIGGLGMGLVAPTLVDVSLSGVHHDDAGTASGVVTTAGQLGGAIGVACIGAAFFDTLNHQNTATGLAADGYAAAFSAALYYEIGVLILAALLMRLLPAPTAAPAPTTTDRDHATAD
jgi:EmrB/QacA subfamily drug resistance transporter